MTAAEEELQPEPPAPAHVEMKTVHGRARCHRCGHTTVTAVCSSCNRLLCREHDRTTDLADPWRPRRNESSDQAAPGVSQAESSDPDAAETDDETGSGGTKESAAKDGAENGGGKNGAGKNGGATDGAGKDGRGKNDGATDGAAGTDGTPGAGREAVSTPGAQTVPTPEPAPQRTTPKRVRERHFCPDCLPLGRPHDLIVQTATAEVALGGLAVAWNPWIGGVLAALGAGRIGWRVIAGRRRRRRIPQPAALFLDPRITKLELTETLTGEVRRRDGRCVASVESVSGEIRMEAVWSRAHTTAVVDHRRRHGLPHSDQLVFSAGSLVVGGPGRFALPPQQADARPVAMILLLRSSTADHPVLADAAGRGDPRWVHTTDYTVEAPEPDAPAPVWVTAALAPGSGGRALELDVQWCFADPVDGVTKRDTAPRAERIEELRLSVPAAWGEVENISGAEDHTTSNVVAGRREVTWERAKVDAQDRGRCHLTVSFQRPLLEKEPDVAPLVDGTLVMTFRGAVSGATGVQVHAAGGARRQDGAARRCKVRTKVELRLDLDLTGLRYQEVRTVPDPARDGDEQRREFRRFRNVTPNHETIALLTDMLSDQGYYVKTVVENPTQTGAGGTRRRVWDISGRRYNGVHPINFHIGLTGDEIEKDNKASGQRSSTRVRLNVSGTYANDDMEHDIVTE